MEVINSQRWMHFVFINTETFSTMIKDAVTLWNVTIEEFQAYSYGF